MPHPTTEPTTLERGFALLALSYLVGTVTPFLNGLQPGNFASIAASVQGSRVAEVAGGLVYLTAALLLFEARVRPLRLLATNAALLIFVLLALASLAWSASPEVSARRLAGVLGCLIVAMFLVRRFSPEQVVRLLAQALVIAVIVSIALSIALPGVAGGLLEAPGGVWGHKNELGRATVTSALAGLALLVSRGPQSRVPAMGLVLASLALIVLSHSAQAVLMGAVALGLIWPLVALVSWRHRRMSWRVAGIILTAAAAAIAAVEFAADPILAALGRDATLTDRTVIWELVADFGWERPWLGHGYAAFWTSRAAYVFGDRWTDLDHAHNGFMDLWLELGFVGLAAFALLLLSAHRRAWDAALAETGSAARFLPAFVIVAALLNTVGHVFPEHNSINWTLLCYAALLPRSTARSAQVVPPVPRLLAAAGAP